MLALLNSGPEGDGQWEQGGDGYPYPVLIDLGAGEVEPEEPEELEAPGGVVGNGGGFSAGGSGGGCSAGFGSAGGMILLALGATLAMKGGKPKNGR